MKVRVTKTMAKAIGKAMREHKINFDECSLVTMSERGYALNVGDIWNADYYGDYDYEEGEYKVIRIVWPYEYYAMPTYITTEVLLDIYKRSKAKTLDEFMAAVIDKIQI